MLSDASSASSQCPTGRTNEEQEWAKQDEDGPKWLQDELEAAERAREAKEAKKQDLFCPACKKRFKSTAQWENHERSKQHVAQVARLKEVEFVRVSSMGEVDEGADEEEEEAGA